MVKYEIKKVLSRSNFKIALIILLFLVGITSYYSMNVSYVNSEGESEYGIHAIRKRKELKKEWAGELDEEKIRSVIRENVRIASTPESKSTKVRDNNIAFGWAQGFSDIRQLLNFSYAEDFHEYDYYTADRLTEDMAVDFYSNRNKLLKERFNNTSYHDLTEKEEEYILNKYSEMKTPLYYDYADGWVTVSETSITIIMISTLVIGYLVAGIFSCEFSWKADSIYFSSYYGRNKAITAKLKAGMSIVTMLYWPTILIYSAIILLAYGVDGGNCYIQTNFTGWRSFYNITFIQEYLIIIVGGYIGCMFMSLLTMLISAKTKSAVVAVMTPFILLFVPSFLSGLPYPIITKIVGLLPDQLLQLNLSRRLFNVYDFFGKIISGVPLVVTLYTVLGIILLPIIYHSYKKTQIS